MCLIRHAEFRRCGRCRSTQVSHIIQNCGINFMPDRRNDWLFTGIGCAGNALTVEHPQILFATAAAGD